MLITLCFSHLPIRLGYPHQLIYLPSIINLGESGLLRLTIRVQKVFNVLHVDLNYAHMELVEPSEVLGTVDLVEDELDAARDDTLVYSLATLHRVSLSRSCLPVREYTDVLAINRTLYQLGKLIKNILLGGIIEYTLKVELMFFYMMIRFKILFRDVKNKGATIDHLIILLLLTRRLNAVKWPNPTVHPNIASEFLQLIVKFLPLQIQKVKVFSYL
jgi:hypothetical protein